MNGRWVLDSKYVHATDEQLPDLPDNPFDGVPSDGVESTRCDPFASTRLILTMSVL